MILLPENEQPTVSPSSDQVVKERIYHREDLDKIIDEIECLASYYGAETRHHKAPVATVEILTGLEVEIFERFGDIRTR